MSKSRLHVVELYAGTARSADPFRMWKRCEISLLVDNNHYAANTYLANFPSAPYVVADLRRLSPRRIRSLAGGRVDILLGCPPCQGFSENGQRRQRDPRNRHLYYFGQFVTALKPTAVAMENVPLAAASARF